MTTWGLPPSAVRRSEAPLVCRVVIDKKRSSFARLDSRGRLCHVVIVDY